MNNYEITKCTKCGTRITISNIGTVKVAGWKNAELAEEMLKTMSIKKVAEQFCSYCLCSETSHRTEEEYNKIKEKDWLPWHEFQPQDNTYV